MIDPRSPETVYVASPGHLFGPNPERGVFKTTDGGRSWNKIKFIDDDTGFTDIAIDPSNSNILYAASYQRRRSGCGCDLARRELPDRISNQRAGLSPSDRGQSKSDPDG